ncbi:MAG: circularly permuted type 2 ATP-grasp protein, partial [Burkholderiales bacterium]
MYEANGSVRPHYGPYAEWLEDKRVEFLLQKQREADTLYTRLGITFAVYGDETGVERAIPFDIIPRILAASAWSKIHDGACQRVRALNAF